MEVWWPEKKYFCGKVTKHWLKPQDEWFVKYDDGDAFWEQAERIKQCEHDEPEEREESQEEDEVSEEEGEKS